MSISHARLLFTSLAVLVVSTGCGTESAPPATTGVAEPSAAPAAEMAAASFPTAPLIDPNTAPEGVLTLIEGLSDKVVAAVVARRPFQTPGELHAAIGALLTEEEQKYVYARMFVKVGLNSGAEADYQLIPSTMSPRKLAHEFEEYRPYESIDQFRREMSKYVSDEEVAYLARFVTLD